MSEAVPPTELLPIFNPANYPGSTPSGIGGGGGAGSFLNFPTAQGIENFPSGITFGDSTYSNSAYPPLEVDETANSYNQIYWSQWPYGGGSGWSQKANGSPTQRAAYAWFCCFAGSMSSPGQTINTPSLGYCIDQYAGGTGPSNPGANVGVYLMVSQYPHTPFPFNPTPGPGTGADFDVLCGAFTPYDSNGFLYVDCSVDGKFIAASDSLGNYPILVSDDYGSTIVTPTQAPALPTGSIYYPQGLQVSNTGQYIVSAIITSNQSSALADGYGTINIYQSPDYGVSQSVILKIDDVQDYFYTAAGTNLQKQKNVYSGIAQSKNGRVICVPYTTGSFASGLSNKLGEQLNAYVSTDYGRTWQLREQIFWYGGYFNGWPIAQCTAISASGQYIYIGGMKNDQVTSSIVGGWLVYSSDYGKTFQSAEQCDFATRPATFTSVLQEINFLACTDSGLGVLAGQSVNDGNTNAPIVWSTQGGKGFRSGTGPEKFWNVFMTGTGQTIVGTNAGLSAGYPSGGSNQGLPLLNNYGL